MQALVDYCLAHGVIVGRSAGGRYLGNTITLAPPLVLTRKEVDRIVSVLDQGIGEVGRTLGA
jgi:adenosylmethionine-8-amino-7-oxononanoate aminotransferase